MSHYSAIMFQTEIDEKTSKGLSELLKKGTKVFFFSYDPIELLTSNEFLRKAVEEQLLFLYVVKYDERQQSDFIYFDGEIPEDLLEWLGENSKYFNKEQYLIEHAPVDENIVVSAGAGTGKTTVMISRVLYLKYKNPNLLFSDIGLITFTNKAAGHMRAKLTQKLKSYFDFTKDLKYLKWMQEVKNMTIGTIHFFAEKVLAYNKEILFENREMQISQFKYKRRKIIEEVIDKFQLENPVIFSQFKYIEQYRIIQSVELILDELSNFATSPERILDMYFGKSEENSHIFYEFLIKESSARLSEHKHSSNAMDVSDLITMLDNMIVRNEKYYIPYQYVIIDEFQDTDRIQTKFFAYLANQFPLFLFAVGDVKQSIYRFRGADYTAFKQLQEQTTVHRTYYLQHNYRTDRTLLEKMNQIFTVWPEYVPAFMFEEKDRLLSGFKPASETQEPFMVKRFQTKVGYINFLREIEETDTAVLLRTNKEVNELSRLCEENNIFYTAEQDGNFYRSVPVREFYMLIRRFTHPNNWKNRYALHQSSYGERTIKVTELIENYAPDRTQRNLLGKVDQIFEEYENSIFEHSAFEVLTEIIEKINPAKKYAERFILNKDKGNSGIIEQANTLYTEYQMNLDQLLFQIKKEIGNLVPTLYRIERLLKLKMQTDKTQSTLYKENSEVNRLSILTIHKAKGLEFDQVFLPDTNRLFINSLRTDIIVKDNSLGYKILLNKGRSFVNDIYRTSISEEKKEDIGEEARLLYVALTRAKKLVIVDAPEQTNNYTVKNWGDLIARGLSKRANQPTIFSH